jgi:hypothetical protein
MARGILLVLSDPITPDVDAEYNDWYDNVHLPEILALPGFTSARRYRMAATQLSSADPSVERPKLPTRYVATYEVEADDLAIAVRALEAARPDLNHGAAFGYDRVMTAMFEEITRR